ncbi:MAG: AraC family transcriptional regulator, partial [Clostridia bacterium]|nr:AraC family transcriptional regulator [Clostridia bacterium]
THDADMFSIDYCLKGRLEYTLENDTCLYLKAMDTSISDMSSVGRNFELPLNQYNAITIAFYFPQAQKSIDSSITEFPVNLVDLRSKFIKGATPHITRNDQGLSKIFLEINKAREKKEDIFFRIKIYELLLYLDSLDHDGNESKSEYYQKSNVDKIKAIQSLITSDLKHHYTLDELSEKFNIPLTNMTRCFKGVFGTTIYFYIKEYKMNFAAKEIIGKDLSVADAALCVGYSNPSKFSKAFKSVMGELPSGIKNRRK